MNSITLPNTPNGWETIHSMRKTLKGVATLRVRGRHPDRKSLIGPYRKLMTEHYPNNWVSVASDEQIHLCLRQDVPLKLAKTLKVYFFPVSV